MPAGSIVHRHTLTSQVKETGQTVEYLQAEIAALRQKKDQLQSRLTQLEQAVIDLDIFRDREVLDTCRKLVVLLREPEQHSLNTSSETTIITEQGEVFFDSGASTPSLTKELPSLLVASLKII